MRRTKPGPDPDRVSAPARGLKAPDIEVGVVLEGDRNQIGDRVLGLLREVARVLGFGRENADRGKRRERKTPSRETRT
jgi:hypothetical protein